MTKHPCRHCGLPLEHQVIDLGHQPPSNAYLTPEQMAVPVLTYPLRVYVCMGCWLVQLPAHAAAEELFTPDYAYFSSTSSSWCAHAERFVAEATRRLGLGPKSLVVELASNDGYLLQYVQQRSIPCLGIEPTHATAEASRAKGIPTIEQFFGLALADELVAEGGPAAGGADLVVANNVLAHVPDINDFLAGIARLLKPGGLVSIECPHLLRLLAGNQFDTIYHEHYSYLSLQVVERIAATVGLAVVDVEELATHGGSLRLWLAASAFGAHPTAAVAAVRAAEQAMGLETLPAWADFQRRAAAGPRQLEVAEPGKSVELGRHGIVGQGLGEVRGRRRRSDDVARLLDGGSGRRLRRRRKGECRGGQQPCIDEVAHGDDPRSVEADLAGAREGAGLDAALDRVDAHVAGVGCLGAAEVSSPVMSTAVTVMSLASS